MEVKFSSPEAEQAYRKAWENYFTTKKEEETTILITPKRILLFTIAVYILHALLFLTLTLLPHE